MQRPMSYMVPCMVNRDLTRDLPFPSIQMDALLEPANMLDLPYLYLASSCHLEPHLHVRSLLQSSAYDIC